jgi:hypothetical protein
MQPPNLVPPNLVPPNLVPPSPVPPHSRDLSTSTSQPGANGS